MLRWAAERFGTEEGLTDEPVPANTRRSLDNCYKARLETSGFSVLTKWRTGLKAIRLVGDIVLSEDAKEHATKTLAELNAGSKAVDLNRKD